MEKNNYFLKSLKDLGYELRPEEKFIKIEIDEKKIQLFYKVFLWFPSVISFDTNKYINDLEMFLVSQDYEYSAHYVIDKSKIGYARTVSYILKKDDIVLKKEVVRNKLEAVVRSYKTFKKNIEQELLRYSSDYKKRSF